MHRILLRKLIYRLKIGTPKAKWLEKFKQEEDFRAVTRFIKRNIRKCYKTAVK